MKTFMRILGLVLVAMITVWNCYASSSLPVAIADLPSVLCGLLTIWGGVELVYDKVAGFTYTDSPDSTAA